MTTNLGHALVQSIDGLDGSGVRKGEHVWPEPYDVSMLFVQVEHGLFWVSSGHIPEAPPVCVTREGMPGVFI